MKRSKRKKGKTRPPDRKLPAASADDRDLETLPLIEFKKALVAVVAISLITSYFLAPQYFPTQYIALAITFGVAVWVGMKLGRKKREDGE